MKAKTQIAKQEVEIDVQQKEAVTSEITSPLLVIAGPGTGKTRVIIERVKHLVKNGLDPSEILCLTFSDKATVEMEERLSKQIDISDMKIRTFHSFAHEILDENVLESGVGISGGVTSRASELVWALNNIDKFGFKNIDLGNDPFRILESMIDGIMTFKNEIVTPDELGKFLENKLKDEKIQNDPEQLAILEQLQDFQKMYAELQKFLRKNRLVDFDDMVMLAAQLLRNKKLILNKYHKKFKYILVDEFQDTNYAQFELVKLLTSSGNVTVVGDEDQSIYRFQGAYNSVFDDFRQTYKGKVKQVVLTQNYRSTKNIINLASKLLKNVPNRAQKQLTTDNEDGDKITVIKCAHDIAEVDWIRKKIQSMLNKDLTRRDGTTSPISPKDITILTRTKRDGKKFAIALNAHNIPAAFVGDAEIFSNSIGRDLIAYLQIASNPSNSGIAINRILKRHGITELNIAKINQVARKSARSCAYSDYLFEILGKEKFENIDQKEELKEISELLSKLADLPQQNTITETVQKIMLNVTDLYKSLTRDDLPETRKKRKILRELQQIANEFETQNKNGTLKDFIQYLQLLNTFDIEIQEGFEVHDAVRVSTIHQSKGREFPIVFIADLAQRKFPGDYRARKFYVPDELAKGFGISSENRQFYLDEERRLFYVGITRAQNHLFLSYARKILEKPRLYSPSQFLEKDLDFMNNPLIKIEDVDTTYSDSKKTFHSKNEILKNDLEKLVIKNIEQTQLNSAIKNILNLARIEYYEKNKTLDGFDHKKLVDFDLGERLELELQDKQIPLINKDLITFSATQFKTYKECAKKYKFSHILKVPETPKTYLALGNVLHKVFEILSTMQKDGKTISKKLGYELLEKYWDVSSYETDAKETQDKTRAKKMIDNFIKWAVANTNKVIGNEIPFQLKLAGKIIRGKIDRLEMDSIGNYYVVDYKTGACYESENSISQNIQMNVYALAVEQKFNKLPLQTSLFYVNDDKIINYLISNKSNVENFKTKLEDMIKSILNEKFDANPIQGFWTCKSCPYRGICDDALAQ